MCRARGADSLKGVFFATLAVSLSVHAAMLYFMRASRLGVRRAAAPELKVSHVELSVGMNEDKPLRAAEKESESAVRRADVPRLPVPPVEAMSVRSSPIAMKNSPAGAKRLDPPPVEVVMTTPQPSRPQAHVEAPARPVRTITPEYPRIARRRGEEGVVEASVRVEADGTVSSVEILKSSGYRLLDDAAREAVMKALFTPARSGGENVASAARISLRFRLR